MASYRVNWHLKHDKDYHAGDSIDLKAEAAAQLVSLGVLTPIEESDEPGEPEEVSASALRAMTKDALAEYGRKRFGVDLNPMGATKDAMLAALAVCVAEDTGDAK